MNCDIVREQLDALADGELKPWAARRVRRHLGRCPACAAELASVQRLTARVHDWRDVSVPTALRQKMPLIPAHRRAGWRPALAALGGAAVVTGIALLTPGQPAHPTITFADVQRAMQQVNMLRYTHSELGYGLYGSIRGEVTYRRAGEVYLRRTPPAKASNFKAYNPPQQYHEAQTLWDTSGYKYFDKTHHTFSVSVIKDRGGLARAIAEQWDFLMDPAHHALALSPEDGSAVPTPAGPEATSLDGRPAWKFVRRYTPISYVPPSPQDESCVDIETIWADPNTARVVQVKLDETADGRVWGSILDGDFRYNQMPPGTFDLAPPPGAHVNIVRTLGR